GPASRTSLRDPTGSASRAMAMRLGTLTTAVERPRRGRFNLVMRVLGLALVLGGIASAAALATPSSGSAPVRCVASVVRYTRTTIGTPWTARGPVTANIFYYGGATLMDGRVNGADGLRIYAGGKAPDGGAMKILWTVSRRQAGGSLALTARRIDGRGLVKRALPTAGGGQFPSIPNLPTAACWR